jgi:hypothetical protein
MLVLFISVVWVAQAAKFAVSIDPELCECESMRVSISRSHIITTIWDFAMIEPERSPNFY